MMYLDPTHLQSALDKRIDKHGGKPCRMQLYPCSCIAYQPGSTRGENDREPLFDTCPAGPRYKNLPLVCSHIEDSI